MRVDKGQDGNLKLELWPQQDAPDTRRSLWGIRILQETCYDWRRLMTLYRWEIFGKIRKDTSIKEENSCAVKIYLLPTQRVPQRLRVAWKEGECLIERRELRRSTQYWQEKEYRWNGEGGLFISYANPVGSEEQLKMLYPKKIQQHEGMLCIIHWRSLCWRAAKGLRVSGRNTNRYEAKRITGMPAHFILQSSNHCSLRLSSPAASRTGEEGEGRGGQSDWICRITRTLRILSPLQSRRGAMKARRPWGLGKPDNKKELWEN